MISACFFASDGSQAGTKARSPRGPTARPWLDAASSSSRSITGSASLASLAIPRSAQNRPMAFPAITARSSRLVRCDARLMDELCADGTPERPGSAGLAALRHGARLYGLRQRPAAWHASSSQHLRAERAGLVLPPYRRWHPLERGMSASYRHRSLPEGRDADNRWSRARLSRQGDFKANRESRGR